MPQIHLINFYAITLMIHAWCYTVTIISYSYLDTYVVTSIIKYLTFVLNEQYIQPIVTDLTDTQ